MDDRDGRRSGGRTADGLTRRGLLGGLATAGALAGSREADAEVADALPSGVSDQRAAFARITAATPIDPGLRAGFVRSKLLTAHRHFGNDPQARARAVDSVARSLGPDARLGMEGLETGPAPGGVGYGVFYGDGFKTGWARGTAISCRYICPWKPGGNVDTWLYLTATNRSALGVEAFVAYYAQETPQFLVFDWARPDHWQIGISFAALGKYLLKQTAHGRSFRVLPVWNATWRLHDDVWRNRVLLYDRGRGGWDLVYRYDYRSTGTEQKTGWIGSWGPIVETFQSSYAGTRRFGVLDTRIAGADSGLRWSGWNRLVATQSYLRDDALGFRRDFLDPNYAFAVYS